MRELAADHARKRRPGQLGKADCGRPAQTDVKPALLVDREFFTMGVVGRLRSYRTR